MNYSIIIRAIGILLLLLGASMCLCVLMGEILQTERPLAAAVDYVGWWVSIGITFATGLIAFLWGRARMHQAKDIRLLRREAVTVVGMGWIVCTVFAALPHYLCVSGLSYEAALFEASSGLTTTGSTIYPSVEELPRTTLLWRSLSQWLGGMGILGAFLLIFSGESKGKTLLSFESSIHGGDLSNTDLRTALRKLWQLYSFLTVICILGLWSMDMNLFQAVNHAMTTTSTAGFGTENDSVSGFSDGVKWWMILFMIICGISFPLYVAMWTKRSLMPLRQHEETRWYIVLIALASVIIVLDNYVGGTGSRFVDSVFNVVSVVTTTGFVVGDYETWPILSHQTLIILMVVGGCSGSTSGGLKVSRVVLWLKSLKNEITRGYRPNVVLNLKLNGKSVRGVAERNIYVVISVAVFFFLLGSIVVNLLEPEMSAWGCKSAVLSSICNIGPAFAELGPTDNFSSLSGSSMLVLSSLMVLGRLEFIAVLVLFSGSLWRKY